MSWTVQDVSIELKNTRYFRERWRTADGEILVGSLPEGVSGNSHFGPSLTSYIIYLSAQLRVTQPLIVEHVRKLGIEISTGQIDRILTEWGEKLGAEKAAILKAGLDVAPYIQVDDTLVRHQGKNGVCTQIGGEFLLQK